MLRRLFFIVPDESKAVGLIAELEGKGIAHERIHAIAGHGRDLGQLPAATHRQRRDAIWRVQQILWNGNLILFVLAAAGLVVALFADQMLAAIVAAVLAAGAVAAGALFALRVPDTHLTEFRGALAHGEILLMADVPRARVDDIEQRVTRHHPEVTPGGVGWTVPRFGF